MLRAAAKNHWAVLPVCDPEDYPEVLRALREGPTPEFGRALARKAFAHTAAYDAAIAEWLAGEKFPEEKFLVLKRVASLRYGENPHQEAALYRAAGEEGPLLAAEVLQGKAMSFNNYLDAEAAWNLVSEFAEPACVAVKHQNPCGVALGEGPLEAYGKAYAADPVSIFGGDRGLQPGGGRRHRSGPGGRSSSRWSSPPPSARRPWRSWPGRKTCASSGCPFPPGAPTWT